MECKAEIGGGGGGGGEMNAVLVPARRWEEIGEMKKGERAGNVHAVNSCTSTDDFG